MSTKNVTLHDENGNVLLPATKTSRITNASGTNLDTLLQQAGQVKSISVNGTAQTIDGNGNVNITISGSGGGGGEANVIESISINGTAQTVTNKNVDLAVPTSSTVTAIVTLTEAQYTALATKDSSTLYIITA